jgi:hypothetical protein
VELEVTGVNDKGIMAMVRAREADELFWSSGRDSLQYRRRRDLAVVEALDSGVSVEQLADELGVRIADVDRMALAGRASSG